MFLICHSAVSLITLVRSIPVVVSTELLGYRSFAAGPISAPIKLEPDPAWVNTVPGICLWQAAVTPIIPTPKVVVASIADTITNLAWLLAWWEGASIGSIQGPDIPLGELIGFSFASVYTIGLAPAVRVYGLECGEPFDNSIHALLVLGLPPIQAHLVPLLDDPVPLCVSSAHQAGIYKLSPLLIFTALLLHELVHLLLNPFLPEGPLQLVVMDEG